MQKFMKQSNMQDCKNEMDETVLEVSPGCAGGR
jgi:hypothetical protein